MVTREDLVGLWREDKDDLTILRTLDATGKLLHAVEPKTLLTKVLIGLVCRTSSGTWWLEGDRLCLRYMKLHSWSPLALLYQWFLAICFRTEGPMVRWAEKGEDGLVLIPGWERVWE